MTTQQDSNARTHVIAPAPRHRLVDEVVNTLRQAILQGHYAPGQALREDHLASMLQVSRGPVREALTRLEREGLVVIRLHRGATVARLSKADLEEVYSLRVALERLAVQFAVRRGTEEDWDSMQAVLIEMAEGVKREMSSQDAADLDMRFHDLVYAAARHKRLSESWSTLQPAIYVFLFSRKVTHPEVQKITVARHQELLDALRARDEELATRIIDQHLEESYQGVTRSYDQAHGEPEF